MYDQSINWKSYKNSVGYQTIKQKDAKNIEYEKYDKVIANEIDRVNRQKQREAYRILKKSKTFPPNVGGNNVWLRDCQHEIVDAIHGHQTGDIPSWLKGSLIRNGPGRLSFGETAFQHLFDGSATLHRFSIENGKVTYQRRFLKCSTYLKNEQAQRIVVTEFGTKAVPDPCKTIFHKYGAQFNSDDLTDNCVISVYPFKDEIYTFSEVPKIYRIDPDTLETLYPVDTSKYVNIAHHTSHPHVATDGTVYNVGLSVSPSGPKYSVIEFPNTKRDGRIVKDVFKEAKIVGKVNVTSPLHPGYMHSFGMTTNYFIIIEQPLCVSTMEELKQKFNHTPHINSLRWFEGQPTTFHVVSRKTGAVVNKFLAETFFYFHTINQYEEDDHIVIDICLYKDPSMINCMFIEALKGAHTNPNYPSMFRARPFRYILPLNPDKNATEQMNLVTLPNVEAKAFWTCNGRIYATPELLCDIGCDMPQINYKHYVGVKYRYFYAVKTDVDFDSRGTLFKIDTQSKTKKSWTVPGIFPSEPIFVPSPQQKSEDDGVVLSVLLWNNDPNKVTFVVLDASSFTEVSRTEFKTDGPVPRDIHGWFVSKL